MVAKKRKTFARDMPCLQPDTGKHCHADYPRCPKCVAHIRRLKLGTRTEFKDSVKTMLGKYGTKYTVRLAVAFNWRRLRDAPCKVMCYHTMRQNLSTAVARAEIITMRKKKKMLLLLARTFIGSLPEVLGRVIYRFYTG